MSTPRKPSGARRAPSPRQAVPTRLVISASPDIPVRLSLCAKGADPFFVTAGESTPIRPGKYAVVGQWRPNWEGRIFGGYVYLTPPLSVDCVVSVPEEGGDVAVDATLDCFALSLGKNCARYRIRGYDGSMMDLNWTRDGHCFIQGAWAYPPLDITAVALPGGAPRTYHVVTTQPQENSDAVRVEYGKAYAFDAVLEEKD